jgi:nickel transport protein
MIRLLVLLVCAIALAPAAEAHKLKVFATVEGTAVTGYAFFVGGGRARGTSWAAEDAAGNGVAAGATDEEGRFGFSVPPLSTSDIRITVDTHEGHIAMATLAADRFGRGDGAPPQPVETAAEQRQTPVGADPPRPEQEIASLIDAAVQRRVGPLMERIEQMDARLRLTDMVSGVFLILGLAGMGLWANGRRK